MNRWGFKGLITEGREECVGCIPLTCLELFHHIKAPPAIYQLGFGILPILRHKKKTNKHGPNNRSYASQGLGGWGCEAAASVWMKHPRSAINPCTSSSLTSLDLSRFTRKWGLGPALTTWSCVFEDKVLIIEFLPVDGLAPSAIVVGEIATLAHELGDNAVEAAPLEAKALLVGAQATEILWGWERTRCSG